MSPYPQATIGLPSPSTLPGTVLAYLIPSNDLSTAGPVESTVQLATSTVILSLDEAPSSTPPPPPTAIVDTSSSTTASSPPQTKSLIAAAAAGAASGIVLLAVLLLALRALRRRHTKHIPLPSPPARCDALTRRPARRAHAQRRPALPPPCPPASPSRPSSARSRVLVSPLSPPRAPSPCYAGAVYGADAFFRAHDADTATLSSLATLADDFPLPPTHTGSYASLGSAHAPRPALEPVPAVAYDCAYATIDIAHAPRLALDADLDSSAHIAYTHTNTPADEPRATTPAPCPKLEAEGGVRVNTSPLPSAEQMRAEALARMCAADPAADPARPFLSGAQPSLSRAPPSGIPRWRPRSRSVRDGNGGGRASERAKRRRAVDRGVAMNGTACHEACDEGAEEDADAEREGRRQRRGARRTDSVSPAPTAASMGAGTADTHATAGTLPPAYARYY
ncbi:hypothetical protein PsYK624_128560 [Phanerochaete sordida]|uniref:Uncharacterized protein n=1 Tax=Phanerochaete sordida TaxID=48140 RepID=A0A9P3LIS9_9APHY|nr:hypothetical protein PsYK624_128560 [Phanerochaete sordida]